MSLVTASIVGSVVRNPERMEFTSGKAKTTLLIAIKDTSRPKTNEPMESDFYRIEAWGRLGEIAHQYVTKGSHIGACGRLVLEKWQDRNGRDRVTPTIKADQISLPPTMRVVQTDEVFPGGGKEPPNDEHKLSEVVGSEDEFSDSLVGADYISVDMSPNSSSSKRKVSAGKD